MPYTTSKLMIGEIEECIKNCIDCKKTLEETIIYSLQMGGKCAAATQVSTMLDASEICQTTANFMMRSSDVYGWICGVCAEICKETAKKLEQFRGDNQLRECREALMGCMESCRHIAGMAVHRA